MKNEEQRMKTRKKCLTNSWGWACLLVFFVVSDFIYTFVA